MFIFTQAINFCFVNRKFDDYVARYLYIRLGSNTIQKYLITNTNTVQKQQIQIQIQILLQLRILNTITNTVYVFQIQLQILSAQV